MSDREQQAALFAALVSMLQASAMQAMGKLRNDHTGKVERNLPLARLLIDMLNMLHERMGGVLEPGEERTLASVLTDLRLNFVDESARQEPEKEEKGETPP
ncbi:MAG: DUF1844 domain-containing protein [Bacteroidota bacterium]